MKWNEFRSSVQYLSAQAQQDIERAFELGKQLHADQKRYSGEPYFTHPIAVATMLADMGADPDTVIAALLHDTVEDTNITLEEIEAGFGESVAALIDGVTKFEPEDVQDNPNLDDRIETIRKMFEYLRKDVRIVVVKLIDRLHNMQTISHLPEEKRRIFAQETYDVFARVADQLCMQDLRDELEQLSYAELEPTLYKTMLHAKLEEENEGIGIQKQMQALLATEDTDATLDIHYEHKSWKTLAAEKQVENQSKKGITSVTLAFLCRDISSAYAILGFLHQHWEREDMSFEDFINTPRLNGYQGLHTTVILENGTRVRCKIRTEAMHVYAHKGIGSTCFDSQAIGILEYLPWTKRIQTLSEDTTERSEEFWQSLQNDILGKFIAIYSSGEKHIDLPEDSTALDGAIYAYGKKALRMKKIYVNGKEVAPWEMLQRADTVSLSLDRHRTVKRSWLEWVQTGSSIAMIRSAIGERPDADLRKIGRTMLQEVMNQNNKGFLEEYSPDNFLPSLKLLGISSLEEVFISIAEGRLEAEYVHKIFFEHTVDPTKASKTKYNVGFSLNWEESGIDNVSKIYKKYNAQRIASSPHRKQWHRYKLSAYLSPDQKDDIRHDLQDMNATNIVIGNPVRRLIVWCCVVLVMSLWGLDPVLAKVFLMEPWNVHPFDFTILRFIAFFMLCSCNLFIYSQKKVSYQKIRWHNPFLSIAGIAMVGIAACTYLSLQHLDPHEYITLASATSLAIATCNPFRRFSFTKQTALAGMLCILSMILVKVMRPDMTWEGYIYGLGMFFAFVIFSISVDEFKQRNAVQARLPSFLFVLSCITLVVSLALIPFSSISTIGSTAFFILLYGLVINGIPYLIYYQFLLNESLPILGRSYPVAVGIAIIIQYFAFGSIAPWTLLPFVLVSISTVLFFLGSRVNQTQ